MPNASGSLVVPAHARHGAVLRVHGLPTLENDSVYQVWLQRDDEVIPESTFTVGENGEGAAAVADDIEAADAVMITRERYPGAKAPTEDAILRVPPLTTLVSAMETCYRHPSRETGVACSSCGRPICPDCMTTTSVGMRCPECAGQKTKVKTMGSVTYPQLTYILIGINVAVGLGSLLSGGGGLLAGSTSLTDDGAVSRFYVDNGEYWRLVTSGFLHYGVIHLALNMFMLYLLGSDLEPSLGRLRFGIVYFVSLLGGSFGALLLDANALTAGASGAVFGLMGSAFVLMRKRGINPFESGLGLLLVLNIVVSFRPGISLGGHIGGLVAGALATLVILELRERRGVPAALPMVAAAAIGVASVVASIAVSASG